MNATALRRKLRGLPQGLTIPEIMTRTCLSYQQARQAVKLTRGYKITDSRSFVQQARQILDPETVDWKLSNQEIAEEIQRRTGKPFSRERVRQWRDRLGKPKVEARGRRRVVNNA